MGSSKTKIGIVILIVLTCLALSVKVWALPCALFCESDKGIVNWQFFGESANEYFFQPSIDKIGDKFDALGKKYSDNLDRTLKERIKDIDEISKQRLQDFSNILDGKLVTAGAMVDQKLEHFERVLGEASEEAIGKLDETFRVNLEDLDKIATAKSNELVAGLDSGLLKFTRVAVWIAVFGGVILIVVGAYFIAFSTKPNKRRLATILGTGAVLCGCFFVAGRLVIDTEMKAQLRPIEVAFAKASERGDLAQGLALAIRLKDNPFNPSSSKYAFEASKLAILRQYFFRSTLLWKKTETQRYITDIVRQLNVAHADKVNANDAELLAVLAETIATHGDTRAAHYLAATLAMRALVASDKRQAGEAYFGIDPVRAATYVLRAYLQYPLGDTQAGDLLGSEAGKVIGLALELGLPTHAELTAVAQSHEKVAMSLRQELFLEVRRLSLDTHLTYSRMLASIFDVSSSATRYRVPSIDQEVVYFHSLKVMEAWQKLLTSKAYKNATVVDRMIVMQAPFAMLQRLEDFVTRYKTLDGYWLTCKGRYSTMRRAWLVHKDYTRVKTYRNWLLHMSQQLHRERLLEPSLIAGLYSVQVKKTSASMGRLLGFETQFLFALAELRQESNSDPGGCSIEDYEGQRFGTSGPPPTEAGYDVVDSRILEELLKDAGALGLIECNRGGRIPCPSEPSSEGGIPFATLISGFVTPKHSGKQFAEKMEESRLLNLTSMAHPIH